MFRDYLHTWDSSQTINQVWSSKDHLFLNFTLTIYLILISVKADQDLLLSVMLFFFSVSAETIPVVLHRHRMPSGMWVTVCIRFMEVKWTAVIKRQSDCSLKCRSWFNVIGTCYSKSNTTVIKLICWGVVISENL